MCVQFRKGRLSKFCFLSGVTSTLPIRLQVMSPPRPDPHLEDRQTSHLTTLRGLFEQELQARPHLYHEVDIERVRTDDWQLTRFLQRADSVGQAWDRLRATLRWKHEMGLHEKRDEHFAREFYEINGAEVMGRNESGVLVVWVTSKYCRDFSDLKEYIKQFVVHEMETLDRMAGRNGLIIVSDAKHAGIFSVDIEITEYSNEMVQQHYPGLVRQSLLINLSILLHPIVQVVLTLLNPELRAITRIITPSSRLVDHLEPQFIPVEYGGTRVLKQLRIPVHAPSYTDMPDIRLTEAQKRRYKALLDKLANQ